jgi:DedD protein
MDEQSKQRVAGAAVLTSLGALVLSMFLVSAPDTGTVLENREHFGGEPVSAVPVNGILGEMGAASAPATRVDDSGSDELSDYPDPVAVQAFELPTASEPVEPSHQGASTSYDATSEEPTFTSHERIEESADRARKAVAEVDVGNTKEWVVQIGSFSDKQNAIALRDRLRESGYAVFLEPANVSTRSMTRVYVGPEPERDDAVASRQKLQHETKLKGIVRPYLGG